MRGRFTAALLKIAKRLRCRVWRSARLTNHTRESNEKRVNATEEKEAEADEISVIGPMGLKEGVHFICKESLVDSDSPAEDLNSG